MHLCRAVKPRSVSLRKRIVQSTEPDLEQVPLFLFTISESWPLVPRPTFSVLPCWRCEMLLPLRVFVCLVVCVSSSIQHSTPPLTMCAHVFITYEGTNSLYCVYYHESIRNLSTDTAHEHDTYTHTQTQTHSHNKSAILAMMLHINMTRTHIHTLPTLIAWVLINMTSSHAYFSFLLMMIAFITIKSSLVPLILGCSPPSHVYTIT